MVLFNSAIPDVTSNMSDIITYFVGTQPTPTMHADAALSCVQACLVQVAILDNNIRSLSGSMHGVTAGARMRDKGPKSIRHVKVNWNSADEMDPN